MNPRDEVIVRGRTVIRHGPLSDRVYLMRLDPADAPGIVDELSRLAEAGGYGKIFAVVPESLASHFKEAGYALEAVIPGMFPVRPEAGRENGLFLGRFTAGKRPREASLERSLAALRLAAVKARSAPGALPKDWRLERLGPQDAAGMAALYRATFHSYPFPIGDPEYLRETMAGHAAYYGARRKGGLLALGACETDEESGLVEMTDFAAAPEARGNGAAFHLLGLMEREMRERGLRTAFTIARAPSIPINVSFARRGYAYAGTLLRNTNISGSLESMNVWFKKLSVQVP